MKKRAWLSFGWRLICPLLLYEILAMAVVSLVGTPMGLTMMETTLIVELAGIPLFWDMYQRDGGDGRLASPDKIPLIPYYVVWAISGAALLAFLSSQLLELTSLTEWSERFQQIDQAMAEESIGIQLLTAVAAAPVMEELLMRGLLYGRLRERLQAGPAILCSALLFGAFHGNLVQGIHAFVLGAFLAWLMERFRCILVPILGHMAANLIAFAAVPTAQRMNWAAAIAIALFGVIRAVLVLKKKEN